jgi:hypothetical protein
VRARFPAGGEHRRVSPAPVEAQQDRGIRAEYLPQLPEYPGQVGGQPGRFTGGEDQGPAAGVHHQGVVAPGLGVAAFGVPALGDRTGAGVGHEVVVDEVNRIGARIGRQHPGGERALQSQRVGPVGQGRQPGPQRRQLRGERQADRRAGLGPT